MNPIDLVSPAWLAAHLGDPEIVVLDGSYHLPSAGRNAADEYRQAHIPGALPFDIDAVKDRGSPLPHMLPSPEEFAAAVGAMGISERTLVVAYDAVGLFSAPRVAWTFRLFGSERVAVLDGGLPAWREEGWPVEAGDGHPRPPALYRPSPAPGAVADAGAVGEALRTGSAQLVDARSASRFTGDEPDPRAGTRAGHMPGARNLHYARLLEGGRMADPERIATAVAEAGIDPARPVITTCGSGVTAAIVSLALERIGRSSVLYDGSWSEWGSREDLPAATGPA